MYKKIINIERYTAEKAAEWDEFVAKSKNGTFLFDRNYMDYHADRFADFSLMFYNDKHKLCALLPANIADGTLYSHQGLTYGGLVTDGKTKAETVIGCFSELRGYLMSQGISRFIYRAIPYIYFTQPSDEDLYALFTVCNSHLLERDISSTIYLTDRLGFIESRRSGIRKAQREELTIAESEDYHTFWDILEANLMEQHGVKPVHTVDEIMLLHSRFPKNIRLFVAQKDGKTIGGTVLYVTSTTIHSQYISASHEGKNCGAIDLLFDHIINDEAFSNYKYFDFGKSTGKDCHMLNRNLLFQKEGFGARAVCYDTYECTF